MADPTPEQRKLQLVEKLEFRILGVANQEKKLHDLLQTFLPPLILEVGSEHAAVRTRVIQVLGRLKTFIQPPSIVLPVPKLLDQYKSIDSQLAKQLDLSFILHSLERIDDDDRRDLLPKALAGSSAERSRPSGPGFLQVIFRLLLDARIPPRGSKEDDAFRKAIGLEDEADAAFLAEMIGIFLRLKLPTATQDWRQSNPGLTSAEIALFSVDDPKKLKIYQRLSELKTKLVTLLASGAFTDDEKFLPALYGSSSFDGRVASTAEEVIKRSSVSLEDETLVSKLFAAHGKLPAAYRTKILGMLSKSSTSTTMSDQILKVVHLDFMEEGLDTSAQGLAPASALERTKLHKALFQYISWVARIGPTKEGFSIGPQLIDVMKSYIESQGWPQPASTSHDDIALRSRAYETIGMLARSARMPIVNRLDLAEWLFRSLSEDPINDAVVNIDGALSSLTANVSPEDGAKEAALRPMLLKYMSLPDEPPAARSTRHAVVKWANQCLPLSDIYGRWIDILAIGGQPTERNDVIEQGHKGLDPWSYFVHLEGQPPLPEWKDMVQTFFGPEITAESAKPGSNTDKRPFSETGPFENFKGARLAAFPVALRYCKQMMFLAALKDFKIEPSWMQSLDALVKTDVQTREQIRDYLRSSDEETLVYFLSACLAGAFQEDSPIAEDCIRCFVEVASLSSRAIIGHLTAQSTSLLPLIRSNNKEKRSLASRALGIIAAHPSNTGDSIRNWFQTLNALTLNAEKAIGPDLNAAEGALLAYSHLSTRVTYYGVGTVSDSDVAYPQGLLVTAGLFPSLQDAVYDTFTQFWSARRGVPTSEGPYKLEEVITKLETFAKTGNEKAIQALGRLAMAIEAEPSTATDASLEDRWGTVGAILTKLFALHEIKQVEVHFTVGEAITAAIARWDADSVKLTLDVDTPTKAYFVGARETLVDEVLTKLFKDCKATKPSLLKASGIWLFSIVQYCSHLEQVQSRLREAQAAFMRLLSARDELVQETASRGLSLVYERGDEDLKSALVKDLVSAFTGTGTQLKVEQDTELFEPGALPTGEGSSVTSYKDIVNLANEVGDQRLVYKFMSLAANAATWSTRSAFGRFGLSNILGDSEVDPKLYPKLFRYRFDPNTNVQRSMDDIWKALVKDSAAVIDTHFDAIIEDLLKSILGREWRMREASCAAISDLLQGRPYAQYEKHYRDVWTAALKVLDDVKGSVREAALKLCMTLSNGLVRQLEESNNVAAAKAMMKEALPFLLSDKGVESSVEDVQLFATITVLKIAKQGGKSLKPFIPDMVQQLLGLLSTIEPQQINYQYQRAGEDSRDKIDRLRSQMVNRSPISEAIENALRFVDADVMKELAPRLENTIKTAIGMPTKIGCSRVLSTLFTRHAQDIEQVSGRFLQLMEKQIIDKNDEVSQAYARASAYMIRTVSEASKERFFTKLMDLYFNAEEDARRQKVSDVIVAVSKVSSDHFSAYQTQLLPFAYLGSHDPDDYTSKMFKEVWEQHAGSSRTVTRYVPEVSSLVERCMDTAQWALRNGGAFTVAAMAADVASASTATAHISEANLKSIWPVFEKALAMKTFAGKEKVLASFPGFVEKGQALWKSDDKIATQMKKIAIREAKRNNEEYRVHAFTSLWKFAKAREDIDMLQDIAEIVVPYLDELKEENADKMDVDSKEDLAIKTAKHGFEAVARGYNREKMSKAPEAELSEILKILGPYLASAKFAQIKREIWYACVKDMMSDATKKTSANAAASKTSVAMDLLQTLDMDQAEAGIESHRTRRAEAALSVIKGAATGILDFGPQKGEVESAVRAALEKERALDVQKVWKQCPEHL